MGIWRFASARPLSWSVGHTSAGTVLIALLAVALLGTACGGGDNPAEQSFSRAEGVIGQLVPEASALSLRVATEDEESATPVDLTVSTALEGEPRMHVISDADAVKGATVAGQYEGFSLYHQKATLWAELEAEPSPLYAGTSTKEGLEAYLDFYSSGEPSIGDERFWNGFAFARERISEAVEEAPSMLVVDFDGEWSPEAGGIRVEAIVGERRLYVGVLYAREGVELGDQGFDQELVDAFTERFAVPDGAEDQPEIADWGYPNRLWYADTAADSGEE